MATGRPVTPETLLQAASIIGLGPEILASYVRVYEAPGVTTLTVTM